MLVVAVLGLSVFGNGQWADPRGPHSQQAIALPGGPSPGGTDASRWMGLMRNPRADGAGPGDRVWPEAGADGQYRVIDACRYDEGLQREHDLILCEGHRVMWRMGEQLRQEALDSVRWSVLGGAFGASAKTGFRGACTIAHYWHNARQVGKAATRQTQTILWSGPGAKDTAEWLANNTGGITLEMTQLGARTELATMGMDYLTQAKPVWEAASRRFVQDASGMITIVLSQAANPSSIYFTVEWKALLRNPRVTGVRR